MACLSTVNEILLAVEHFQRYQKNTQDPYELSMLLYGNWYARPQISVKLPEHFPVDLVQALRAADATGQEWQGGWSADRIASDGRVIARRGNEVRMADRCDYIAHGSVGILPRVGDQLILAGRRDRIDSDGVWWRTGGRKWRFTQTIPDLVRLYWSFELGYLPELVKNLTRVLADDDHPWLLKCAVNPEVHTRADATVLYMTWSSLENYASQIDTIAAELLPYANSSAPPLTLQIHPGVAVAVDSTPNESFGQHRCRLIVEALLSSRAANAEMALYAIANRMEAEEIDFDRPYAFRKNPRFPWER